MLVFGLGVSFGKVKSGKKSRKYLEAFIQNYIGTLYVSVAWQRCKEESIVGTHLFKRLFKQLLASKARFRHMLFPHVIVHGC